MTRRAVGRSPFAALPVVNLAVALTVAAGGLVAPALVLGQAVLAGAVALALAAALALARRQGFGPDDARLSVVQWTLFAATWAGIVLAAVASRWAWALALAAPGSVAPRLGDPPREQGWVETLHCLSWVGGSVAAAAWLVLVVHLSARLRRRRSGRRDATHGARPPAHHRWPDLVFVLMIPGHLAITVWVVSGVLFGESGDLGLVVAAIVAVPALLIALFVSTLQAVRAVPWVHGSLLTAGQAWLQLGVWASLGAVGAGLTVTGRDTPEASPGQETSAILALFPGSVDASQAVAWIGAVGSVVAYTLLLVSLRKRRLVSAGEGRAVVRERRRAGAAAR